jgi:hypothetical protein
VIVSPDDVAGHTDNMVRAFLHPLCLDDYGD